MNEPLTIPKRENEEAIRGSKRSRDQRRKQRVHECQANLDAPKGTRMKEGNARETTFSGLESRRMEDVCAR
jgi:hypothetical protein